MVLVFAGYMDVPMNPLTLARLNFWALDPDAAELDPTIQIESQMVAIDAFSQLFAESCAFHFGFLVDLDNEYHRLRPAGVVGVLNDTAEHTPWYNLYHYWRNVVQEQYLDTGLVQLPAGAIASNWRITDVLNEIIRLMAPDGSNLLPDIKLSTKGVLKGQLAGGFGLLSEDTYLDADGNSRFYVPWMSGAIPGSEVIEDPLSVNVMGDTVDYTVVTSEPTSKDNNRTAAIPQRMTSEYNDVTATLGTSSIRQDNYFISGTDSLMEHLSSAANEYRSVFTTGDSLVYGATLGSTTPHAHISAHLDGSGDKTRGVDNPWNSLVDIETINRLPSASFVGGRDYGLLYAADGTRYVNWTGHSLNLVDLIAMARRMGRALESEVAEAVLPVYGQVMSLDGLMSRGTGMSAKFVPKLYNLYASSFSFNENPIRTFTAAHLGPSDLQLPAGNPGDEGVLSIEGNVLSTVLDGQTVTARERYWTPPAVSGAQAATTMAALFAGSEHTFGLAGVHRFDTLGQWDGLNTGLVARALGTNNSMLQKVEKPVILPAGVADPDAVYASGVGRGTLELVNEIVFGSTGAVPRFGLGMSGFSDIVAETAINDAGRLIVTPQSRLSATTTSGLTAVAGVEHLAVDDQLSRQIALLNTGWDGTSVEAVAATQGGNIIDADVSPYIDIALAPSLEFSPTSDNGAPIIGATVSPTMMVSDETAPLLQTATFQASIGNQIDQWGYLGMRRDKLQSFVSASLNADYGWAPDEAIGILCVPESLTVGAHTVQFEFDNQPLADTAGHSSVSMMMTSSDSEVSGHPVTVGVNKDMTTLNYHWLTASPPTGATNKERSHVYTYYPSMSPYDLVTTALKHLAQERAEGNTMVALPAWDDVDSGSGATGLNVELVMRTILAAPGSNYLNTGVDHTDPAEDCLQLTRYTHNFHLEKGLKDGWIAYNAHGDGRDSFSETDDLIPYSIDARATIDPSIGGDVAYTPEVRRVSGITMRFIGTDVAPHASNSPSMATYETWWNTHAPNSSGFTTAAAGGFAGQHLTETTPLGYTYFCNADAVDTRECAVFHPAFVAGGVHTYAETALFAAPERLKNTPGTTALSMDTYVHWDQFAVEPLAASVWDDGRTKPLYGSPTTSISEVWNAQDDTPRGGHDVVGSKGPGTFTAAHGLSTPITGSYQDTQDYGSGVLSHGFPSSVSSRTATPLRVQGLTIGATPMTVAGLAHPALSIDWAQASFMYPDDPAHKMLYRPWREYVDAAVAKELRYTFPNRGDASNARFGELGIELIGTRKEFRFDELVRAGMEDTFLLEKASSKTRMINKDNRGILVFTKNTLLDPDSLRHMIPDATRALNAMIELDMSHKATIGGTPVLTRDFIRNVQMGKTVMRQR
jgi:hypothetical protein